ncbi:nucleic-acid-binding protein from transposon X-element [Trichonephila clavipes]|nr:nucleic-acid-binding protein from transposon X-element [Trichonephila clavipes]
MVPYTTTLVLPYTAIKRPTFVYACPYWGYAANSKIKILDTVQKCYIRMITKATRYTRNDDIMKALKINSFKECIQKIQAESSDHHREITQFLTDKGCQDYVTDPPANRPLKLVIKGLLATTEPEEIKKDLIDQGIKIEKIAQLRQFKTKSPLPIFMIEITRDENVDDIFKIRSCLYLQVKFDPFRKNSRPTQCYNCNFFHHASQNCSMKTLCLKCGGGHRTGQCEIKEKIINPTCINCNAQGHMASSTECPLFSKPRKGKGQSQKDNKKRNENTPENSAFITPGLSFAQVTSGQNSQQRAARGNDSSTSNSDNKNKNKSFNSETLNHINCQCGDFSFLEAIFEMRKIFDLFPNLISEMKKSSKCTPTPQTNSNVCLKVSVPQYPQ